MGTGKHLMISATGFPGTNKTWRFLQTSFREPLEAFAKVSGDKTIVAGLIQSNVGGITVVADGYISFQGEILPFTGGPLESNVTLIETVEFVNYDVDFDNDGQQDSLPGYKTRYLKFGTEGIDTFPFAELTRLKTIKELSEFSLPDGIVIDADYLAFTQSMLDHLNSIQANAEENVQVDWDMTTQTSDAFIKNKPFKAIAFTHGNLQVSGVASGDWRNNYTKNYIWVYPPTGFTIQHLAGFIPSIGEIHFAGDVNNDDKLYCSYQVQTSNSRVVAICSNSEISAAPRINFLAIWKK